MKAEITKCRPIAIASTNGWGRSRPPISAATRQSAIRGRPSSPSCRWFGWDEGDAGPPLAPTEGEAADIGSDTDGPRPVVESSGPPGASGRRGRLGAGSDNPGLSPEAKRDYDAALSQVRAKQYDKALDAFTAFLVHYPDHVYADNAMYWRGECFYAKGDFAKAAEQFEGLLARFPYGNKAPDALLKVGLCQQRLGSREQAQKTFASLRDRYPKSEAVRQIPRP